MDGSTAGGRHRHPRRSSGSRLDRMAAGVLHWPWLALAALAVLVLAWCLRDLPADLAAARGQGVTGTFTAEEDLGCGRSLDTGCSWRGSFESDDGTIHVEDVSLFDGEPGSIGGTTRVRYVGSLNQDVVYMVENDTTWLANAGLIFASSGYLCVFAVALVARVRQAR